MSKHHDRSKSTGGGILDMWFGRPKYKGKYANTISGTRPIASETESYTDVQELNTEILKLSVEEVDQKFLEILDDMNIPKDKRQPLLLKSLGEKREMLFMHLKGKHKMLL